MRAEYAARVALLGWFNDPSEAPMWIGTTCRQVVRAIADHCRAERQGQLSPLMFRSRGHMEAIGRLVHCVGQAHGRAVLTKSIGTDFLWTSDYQHVSHADIGTAVVNALCDAGVIDGFIRRAGMGPLAVFLSELDVWEASSLLVLERDL